MSLIEPLMITLGVLIGGIVVASICPCSLWFKPSADAGAPGREVN